MGVEKLNTEIILPKEQVDNTKLDIDWVKLQIETQTAAKALRDEILNDTDRKLTHAQIVTALKQYENQGWPQVIDKNTAAYVISLQLALKAAGYDPGKIDALYGKSTTDAVKAFQKAVGLKEDGSAGPYTIAKLIEKLGGDPKELTPDARSVSIPAEAAPATPEVVAEKPKDLVEALKKRPLTAFDKKWLKENLGVKDITKIPAWKEGCNGVAYWISNDGMETQISMQKNGKTEGKCWGRGSSGDKYAGEWKNNDKEGKGTYMYNNGDKYVGEWKNGRMEGKGTYYYKDGRIGIGQYKDRNSIGIETFVNPKNTKQVLYTVQWSNNEVVTDKNGNEVRNITDITKLPKGYTWSDAAIYQIKNILTGQTVTFYGNGRCYTQLSNQKFNTKEYVEKLNNPLNQLTDPNNPLAPKPFG